MCTDRHGRHCSKHGRAFAEGANANACQALDAFLIFVGHLSRCSVSYMQGACGTVDNTVATVHTAILVPCTSLIGVVDICWYRFILRYLYYINISPVKGNLSVYSSLFNGAELLVCKIVQSGL